MQPTIAIEEPPSAASIVVVAAHPDDIESWCAGTLAQSIDAGAAARLLLVTSGDKGTSDPAADPADVAQRREAEAGEAARLLGIKEVRFLRHLDGEVEDTRTLRGEVVFWLRTWRPEVVFTHDPESPFPPYLAHRDHRVTGRACLDAIYPSARDPLSFPEQLATGLSPHAVEAVWLFASAIAGTYIDIREGFDRKIAARLAHVSQTPDPVALEQSWKARAARIGEPVGLALAESFTVLRT